MAQKKHNRLNVARLIAQITLTTLLAACASNPTVSNRVDITQSPTQSAQDYLMRADSSEGSIQNDWLIMALKAAVKENQAAQANLLLFRLTKQDLTETQQAEWQLSRARLLLNRNQDEAALKQFAFKPWWKLPDAQWLAFYQTKADIFMGLEQWFDATRALVEVYDLSAQNVQPRVARQIWQTLSHYSATEVTELEVASDEDELAGWLQLAIYMKTLDSDLAQLKNTLEKWLAENSKHPAALHIPGAVKAVLAMKITTPKRTALLLPLSGKFSQQAQLIRDGFMFAMMNDRDRGTDMTLNVIDTHEQPLPETVDQLMQKHIDFVVGPLIKEDITQLKQIEKQKNHQIPMLALNIPEEIDSAPGTCYFALSPEQEASQAAKHLFRLGYQYPLILAPQGSYGERVADAFRQEWLKYSKHPLTVSLFGEKRQLQKDINAVFGLQSSQKNIAQMESLLDMKLESQPRSRRDIDAVYIVANSAELTLLKPFIEVAINPDTTQPKLFSSSRSNSNNQYEDLSGVTFSDIPLLIQPQATVKEQMETLWPKDSNAEKRLKAMGMDAYTLMSSLSQMKAVEGYQVQGQTGTLSIDSQCIVQQELSWGEYGSL
ncbi:penicillin-binding protein activator [Vibrio mangrovi]|uniref:Penicillin-binding protein activator LpoA n=1 Tax=Vibrio mangrovi TaxID=474394 RepID=A0A1Y6IRG6_9VIBR|nr:penicillin-binding protein activator [Vibrio mangrovi]MDW6001749.1 penicillin-binding protein activator [Vibrio mangrovi]SMS00225.1 Penicillin-binding protein activator LpoA precursor [Vibrio mangrovi]